MDEKCAESAGVTSVHRRPDGATLDVLRTLIQFPTVSRNPNRGLIEWVEAYLARFDIASRITQGGEHGKANLFATIGAGEGGIVLSGHSDVVPVDGQNWTSEPFDLTEKGDGRVYGRGTADMKGFVAVVLAKVPRLLEGKRKEPVHIALSFDEEVGCKGVPHLLDDLMVADIRPRACIVGEPTSMRAVVGHKTGSVFGCTVEGRETHSSLAPQGVNALEYAARLIGKILDIGDRLEREEKRHDGYEVPYSTLQSCVIEAGHAANIVPAHCAFRFDMRTLPWTDPKVLLAEILAFAEQDLLPAMRKVAPQSDIRIEQKGQVPGFDIPQDAPLVRYVQRLIGSNAEPAHVAYGTEAGLFQQRDIPTLVCGPGSIAQAHRPDEYIELGQLVLCEDFIDRLADSDLP